MEKMADFINQPLLWRSVGFLHRQYELRSGGFVVAGLAFRSVLGSFAVARSADGCWIFERIGSTQMQVTIRACDCEEEIAAFKNSTRRDGGAIVFRDGRHYWASTNFWRTRYEFTSQPGETLIQFRCRGLLGSSAEVEIQPRAKEVAALPWMACLGWYLLIIMHRETLGLALPAMTWD